jgi:hypothetical protein
MCGFSSTLSKAKTDKRDELRSSPQTAWSRRLLRSRAYLQSAPCSSSLLGFLKHQDSHVKTPVTFGSLRLTLLLFVFQ